MKRRIRFLKEPFWMQVDKLALRFFAFVLVGPHPQELLCGAEEKQGFVWLLTDLNFEKMKEIDETTKMLIAEWIWPGKECARLLAARNVRAI